MFKRRGWRERGERENKERNWKNVRYVLEVEICFRKPSPPMYIHTETLLFVVIQSVFPSSEKVVVFQVLTL